MLLGYTEDAKAYKLMELKTMKCFIECNVQFEEDQLFDLPPSEAQEGITTLPLPFDDDDFLHVSDSDEEDQDQHDLGIEDEPHEIIDPYPTSLSNQRPKPRWAQNLIAAAGDGARIQKTEGEQGSGIRMSMLLSLSQIHSLQSGATRF